MPKLSLQTCPDIPKGPAPSLVLSACSDLKRALSPCEYNARNTPQQQLRHTTLVSVIVRVPTMHTCCRDDELALLLVYVLWIFCSSSQSLVKLAVTVFIAHSCCALCIRSRRYDITRYRGVGALLVAATGCLLCRRQMFFPSMVRSAVS